MAASHLRNFSSSFRPWLGKLLQRRIDFSMISKTSEEGDSRSFATFSKKFCPQLSARYLLHRYDLIDTYVLFCRGFFGIFQIDIQLCRCSGSSWASENGGEQRDLSLCSFTEEVNLKFVWLRIQERVNILHCRWNSFTE